MTQKELLYLEDAVSHEENIIKIIEQTKENLQDEKLRLFLEKELQDHVSMKKELIEKLEEKANVWSTSTRKLSACT